MLKEDIEKIFQKYLENYITECVVRTKPASVSMGTHCSVKETTIERGRMKIGDDLEDLLVINGIPKRGFFPVRRVIAIDAVVPFERVKKM